MFGEALERQLQRMIALSQAAAAGHAPRQSAGDRVGASAGDARDKTFFEQRERLDVIAARMTTPTRTRVA